MRPFTRRVNKVRADDNINAAAANACIPAHNVLSMAPTEGLPLRAPSAPKHALMPNLVVILLKSVVNLATEGVCSDTIAPEHKPYSALKTTSPAAEFLNAI